MLFHLCSPNWGAFLLPKYNTLFLGEMKHDSHENINAVSTHSYLKNSLSSSVIFFSTASASALLLALTLI